MRSGVGARVWFAGVAAIVTALIASAGDVLATIEVRGGSIPTSLAVTLGFAIALGGVWGWRATRD